MFFCFCLYYTDGGKVWLKLQFQNYKINLVVENLNFKNHGNHKINKFYF